MKKLTNAKNQQEVLRSPFDVATHKATFINYLEVVITADGKIHYAVPSHQQFLLNRLMKERNLTRQELDDLCPEKYHFDYNRWLAQEYEAVLVYNKGFQGDPNDEQLDALQMLKDEGLLDTVVPPKTIEYLYREQYQKVMAHIDALIKEKQIDSALKEELERAAFRQFSGTGPRKAE